MSWRVEPRRPGSTATSARTRCAAPIEDALTAYYARGREAGRLFDTGTPGPLELARTTELLARFLPDGLLSVLDVGGGAAAYAERP